MRPPPKEAEYLDHHEGAVWSDRASMRPPPKEAEYGGGPARRGAGSSCFNEAASQRGGIPVISAQTDIEEFLLQ